MDKNVIQVNTPLAKTEFVGESMENLSHYLEFLFFLSKKVFLTIAFSIKSLLVKD